MCTFSVIKLIVVMIILCFGFVAIMCGSIKVRNAIRTEDKIGTTFICWILSMLLAFGMLAGVSYLSDTYHPAMCKTCYPHGAECVCTECEQREAERNQEDDDTRFVFIPFFYH